MTLVAAVIAIAGVTVGVAALVVLHALPTGLSPVRDAVSHYGITRFRWGYRVQTVAYAVAGAGVVAGLVALPGHYTLTIALCALFTLCRAVIGWAPMDAPGTPATSTGRTHGILAIGAFASLGLAAGVLPRSLARAGVDAVPAAVSGILAIVMLAALVGMSVDRRAGARHFGFIERVFYAAMTAWLVLVAVILAA